MSIVECYNELGLIPNSDLDLVKKTYKKLAKLYHPDLNPNNPNAASKFDRLTKAYNVIINSGTCIKIRTFRSSNGSCPNCGGLGYTLAQKKTAFGSHVRKIRCPLCGEYK